jgi:putative ABC transport system permease protein
MDFTTILHDFRLAVRTLIKARGFTIVAVLTLAFALGANTAIFSVIQALLLRPLPFRDPAHLLTLTDVRATERTQIAWLNNRDIGAQSRTLEQVGALYRTASFIVEGEPERVWGVVISKEVLPILGVNPIIGRTFNADEMRPDGPRAMLISYELWQRRFGGDRTIVGRGIHFGGAGNLRTIIGVMPARFRFPAGEKPRDFWLPLEASIDPDVDSKRDNIYMDAIARAKTDATPEQIAADLDTISRRLVAQYPKENTGLRLRATPMSRKVVDEVRTPVLLLFGAVAVVLLIGCANVANLLLARAAARHKEISIRAALGATRGRIISQLLAESVVLALLAGVIGLLLAAWGVDALLAVAPAGIPRLEDVAIDGGVLLFTLVLAVFTGIVFGLAPAIAATKTNLTDALKEGTRGSTEGRGRNRIRAVLVSTAIALSVVLLAGTGLTLRSFLRVTSVNAGYDYRDTITLQLAARSSAYKEWPQISALFDRIISDVRALPGVQSVSAATAVPLATGEIALSFSIVGRPRFAPGEDEGETIVVVRPGFFATMRTPMLRGRDITDNDTDKSPMVLIVNESFAKKYFPHGDVLGQKLDFDDKKGPREIVGVAADMRFRDLTTSNQPIIFLPHRQDRGNFLRIVVRAKNAAALAPSLREIVRRIDPQQPIYEITSLESLRAESLATRRFTLILLSLLAALALVLATVGIYSIMSYNVTQRTTEIGIRMALGAASRDILRLIVGNALRLIIFGVIAGLAIALTATRVMESLLYGIAPTDPLTFAAICATIAATGVLASVLPASRAARVDPLVAIRNE